MIAHSVPAATGHNGHGRGSVHPPSRGQRLWAHEGTAERLPCLACTISFASSSPTRMPLIIACSKPCIISQRMKNNRGAVKPVLNYNYFRVYANLPQLKPSTISHKITNSGRANIKAVQNNKLIINLN